MINKKPKADGPPFFKIALVGLFLGAIFSSYRYLIQEPLEAIEPYRDRSISSIPDEKARVQNFASMLEKANEPQKQPDDPAPRAAEASTWGEALLTKLKDPHYKESLADNGAAQIETLVSDIENRLEKLEPGEIEERMRLLEAIHELSFLEQTESIQKVLLSQATSFYHSEDPRYVDFSKRAAQYYIDLEPDLEAKSAKYRQFLEDVSHKPEN